MFRSSEMSDSAFEKRENMGESQLSIFAADCWIPQQAIRSTVSEVVTYLDGKITSSGADAADQKVMKELVEALAKADLGALSKTISGLDSTGREQVTNVVFDALRRLGVVARIDKGVKGDTSDDVVEFVDKAGKQKLMIPLDGSPAQGGDETAVYTKNSPKLDPSDPKWTPGSSNPLADRQEENAGFAAAAIQSRLREEVKKKL